MKSTLITVVGAFLLFFPSSAKAEEQTITLKVDGMTCASCPYQVQSALKRVDGVMTAVASLENGNAIVTFDDAVTNVPALTQATASAGFPSTLDSAANEQSES